MQFDDYRVEIIPDTEFRLDGGTMFGVVPRVLWEKKCPPDELNRIRMNMNCLYIETPDERVLVETGIGEKWSDKKTAIFGISREKPFSQTLYEKTGCHPEDISIVVNTHLHFDHAGGNTIRDSDQMKPDTPSVPQAAGREFPDEGDPPLNCTRRKKGKDGRKRVTSEMQKIVPQFSKARYFVSESEFEHANTPHERDRASYLPENWRPLEENGQLELKPDNYEVIDGLTMQTIRGHSETMQTVKLERGGKTLYGFADLIPMKAHLPLPWIAGFDLFPTETLEAKRNLIKQAVGENWICLMYHDFETPLCRFAAVDGKLTTVKYTED